MAIKHKQRKKSRHLKSRKKALRKPIHKTPVLDKSAKSFGGKYWVPLTSAILVTSYSYALGIQEIQVNSNLGEPLSAMVYLSTSPGERINPNCFGVVNGSGNSGLPVIENTSLSMTRVGGQLALQVRSSTPVKEPISQLSIATTCSSLPVIERSYTLMLDPAPIREERYANSIYQRETPVNVVNSNTSRSALNTRSFGGNISQGSTYVVKVGDTLSTIAARISDRPYGSVWSLAAELHANNPSAFTNNNPNLIELGASLDIPVINNDFSINEASAQANLSGSSTISSSPSTRQVSSAATARDPAGNFVSSSGQAQQYSIDSVSPNTNLITGSQTSPVSFVAPQVELPTMTMSMRLSSVSMERIQGRAEGISVATNLLPDTSRIFPQDQEEQTAVEPAVVAAVNTQQAPSTPQISTPNIQTPGSGNNTDSGSVFGRWTLLGLLASLLAMGLATWKLLVPYLRRKARLNFIRTVRSHKQKQKFIEKTRQRKAELRRNALDHGLIATEVESLPASRPVEVDTHEIAHDDLNPFSGTGSSSATSTVPTLKLEDDELNDFSVKQRKSGGPRKSNVAEEIYEVGMIDDTGELVSLTTAFPELEAELNARLGSDIPDLGEDLTIDEFVGDLNQTRQTTTMEINSDDFAGLQLDPELYEESEVDAETRTVKLEGPLTDSLDLELPGLMEEDTVNMESDFEAIAQDSEFSKTMVFNDEVFTDAKSIGDTTVSTEMINAEDETRPAPTLIDDDGLTPADFGLADEEFPVDREDFSYLEPDASIITEALQLTPEELEELGMGDDDNIIPFDPERKKSA